MTKTIRDRIVELRRVRAGELRPNPRNWRRHPKRQREALRALLSEVGFADAILARELEDGSLEIVDGHVGSPSNPTLEWSNSVLIEGDAAEGIAALKEEGRWAGAAGAREREPDLDALAP